MSSRGSAIHRFAGATREEHMHEIVEQYSLSVVEPAYMHSKVHVKERDLMGIARGPHKRNITAVIRQH